jgi:hypothetical protein
MNLLGFSFLDQFSRKQMKLGKKPRCQELICAHRAELRAAWIGLSLDFVRWQLCKPSRVSTKVTAIDHGLDSCGRSSFNSCWRSSFNILALPGVDEFTLLILIKDEL